MATTPKTYFAPTREIESVKTIDDLKKVLHLLVDQISQMHLRMRDDVITFETKFDNAVSGWVDDGTNFRLTMDGGIVTKIENSSGGGHS